MSVTFRPMPWLTTIAALMLAILISLGVWQYKRLHWKTNLLAEVEASVTAPPLTSLEDLERAIAAGEPVDFRRIAFRPTPIRGAPVYHVYKSQAGGIYWDIYGPVEGINASVSGQPVSIFARWRTIETAEKANELDVISTSLLYDHIVPYYGYVRTDHPMGRVETWLKSKPNRETNRWFKFNQDGSWGKGMPNSTRLSHYIDVEPGATAADNLPVRRPSIRNNHRDYMLTWFSFAVLLLIFYAMIHRRAGRFTW